MHYYFLCFKTGSMFCFLATPYFTNISRGQTLYQTQSEERDWSSEGGWGGGGCAEQDPRFPGEKAVLVRTPNYRGVNLCTLLIAALFLT